MMVTRRHTQNKMALAHQCMTYRRVQRTRQQQQAYSRRREGLNRTEELGRDGQRPAGERKPSSVLCIRDYMVILRRRVVSSNENSGEWKRQQGRGIVSLEYTKRSWQQGKHTYFYTTRAHSIADVCVVVVSNSNRRWYYYICAPLAWYDSAPMHIHLCTISSDL